MCNPQAGFGFPPVQLENPCLTTLPEERMQQKIADSPRNDLKKKIVKQDGVMDDSAKKEKAEDIVEVS